jgi:ATP-dependent DNA helicase RecG
MNLKLTTPIASLHEYPFMEMKPTVSRKLAVAVAAQAFRTDVGSATVEDLLNYFPMRYEDRSNFVPIDQLTPNLEASVELYVRVAGAYRVGKNRSAKAPPLFIFEINAADIDRKLRPVIVWWFISGKAAPRIVQYYQERFAQGTRFVAFGKWEWDSRRGTLALRVTKPDDLEILPPNSPPDDRPAEDFDGDLEEDIENPRLSMVHTGRFVPIYRKLGPFMTKRIREITFCLVSNLDFDSVEDSLPKELLERRRLCTRAAALRGIHFPPDGSRISDYGRFRSEAHRRLIFEEFFWLTFALALRRGQRLEERKEYGISISEELEKRLFAFPPFDLTPAQTRVMHTILDDMASGKPMNRLVQGDVGCGKTIIAFTAMLAAMENGLQAALMAPTEILAEQHARNAAKMFAGTDHHIVLLTGSVKAAQKKEIRDSIASGKVGAVIGTHAVIQDGIEFQRLGLAVIDEQHRFGVMQRAELRARGLNPDVLVMTATPIPRSLAMTVYGDLDVSVIDELPPGRTPIKTVVLGEDQRDGVYRGIERELKLGRQVYVVYPLIQESERSDLKAATKMFEELRVRDFPFFSVGLLHGKMKSIEKESVMAEFVAGKIDILVSTTVVEVGVDVPNASLMIIEHAERFGLSQLHQLRGRVGRGAEQSYCVLLTGDKQTSVAKERLGIMEETSDGFRIAEKDLEIRGPGEVLGTRQAGIQSFRVANLIRDLDILQEARAESDGYLEPTANAADAELLKEAVLRDPRFHLGGIG